MLSALISSGGRKPAMLLAEQLAHESSVRPGPLVLGTALLKSPTPTEDRDRHILLPPALPLECRGQIISVWLCMSPCRSDYIFTPLFGGVRRIVSEDSGCCAPCTRRYRPPPFMESASATSAAKPDSVRCSFRSIARTMRAKVRNSPCFELTRGCVSKNGMTLVSRSSLRRTTNTNAVSALARWFSRI